MSLDSWRVEKLGWEALCVLSLCSQPFLFTGCYFESSPASSRMNFLKLFSVTRNRCCEARPPGWRIVVFVFFSLIIIIIKGEKPHSVDWRTVHFISSFCFIAAILCLIASTIPSTASCNDTNPGRLLCIPSLSSCITL